MEIILDLIKILLPAALVLYGMYVVVQAFARKELNQIEQEHETQLKLKQADLQLKQKDIELKNKTQSLPVRLQAYERMTLFLERISPAQLIPRLNNGDYSVSLFQQVIIQEIRNEFSHNLAQQIYLSNDAWLLIKKSMEETILLVNNSIVKLDPDAPGIELAKAVLSNAREHDINPTEDALTFLKDEVAGLF